MNSQPSPFGLPPRQRGAVLIIALIMLLLLTMIGLGSMRGTALQENMAGNLRDSSLALQAAEAALRHGEGLVADKFAANTLSTLDSGPQSGSYPSFPGVATAPGYRITQLAKLRTTTEAGVPMDGEGAIVRIEAEGFGITVDSDSSAAARVELRTTYLVEQ